jgi:glycosyltransferase involved in cell wall biosynthesis
MNSPFFSIILPTYNRANLISETIKSVLGQSFVDFELIVVDDGSKDHTQKVVNSFGDVRVKYFYQNNSERSAARNNGIEKSEGKFICFIDSDDLFHESHLQVLFDEIEKHSFERAFYHTNVCEIKNEVVTKIPAEYVDDFRNQIEYILLVKHSIIPARVCIAKEILQQLKFNKQLNISEDLELFCRIAARYPVHKIDVHTVYYRIHETNSTNLMFNPFPRQLVALKILFRDKEVARFISRKARNKKLASCYDGIARFNRNNFFKMFYYFFKASLLDASYINIKKRAVALLDSFKKQTA